MVKKWLRPGRVERLIRDYWDVNPGHLQHSFNASKSTLSLNKFANNRRFRTILRPGLPNSSEGKEMTLLGRNVVIVKSST